MDNVTKIGSGGKLYADAREKAEAVERGKPPPAEQPQPPPTPPWTVSATGPEPVTPPAAPAPRDWQGLRSTLAEITGMGLISTGVAMQWLWAGIVVAGICLVALGVASGLPGRPR